MGGVKKSQSILSVPATSCQLILSFPGILVTAYTKRSNVDLAFVCSSFDQSNELEARATENSKSVSLWLTDTNSRLATGGWYQWWILERRSHPQPQSLQQNNAIAIFSSRLAF